MRMAKGPARACGNGAGCETPRVGSSGGAGRLCCTSARSSAMDLAAIEKFIGTLGLGGLLQAGARALFDARKKSREAQTRLSVDLIPLPEPRSYLLEVRYQPEGSARRFKAVVEFLDERVPKVTAVTQFDRVLRAAEPVAPSRRNSFAGRVYQIDLTVAVPEGPVPVALGGIKISAPRASFRVLVSVSSFDGSVRLVRSKRRVERLLFERDG